MSGDIRVLVADDQAIVRDGLVTVLGLVEGIAIVGEAADGAEAHRLALEREPDVVLMDLRMPLVDGVEATRRILSDRPGTAVLVLTTFDDDESVGKALRAGALGYLTKGAGRAELASAVRSVASGHLTVEGPIGGRLLRGVAAEREPSLADRFPELTPRERDVLERVARGLDNREIAAELYVSVATVKSHINALFSKLGVRDRAQAIALVASR